MSLSRTSVARRSSAIFLLLVMLWSTLQPTVAYALTGGPSQPEFSIFEPIGTDQMVDLFTGDFTYNLPLLTVPGPNGSYPINLAYHSGIGMEQEASWVGLGWTLNAGAINRNLRGLPDDFNGDQVTKTVHMEPQHTVGFSFAPGVLDWELFGFPMANLVNLGMYYNSYRGVGHRIGLNPWSAPVESGAQSGSPFSAGLNFDSQSGLGFDASISFGQRGLLAGSTVSGGLGLHSRQGIFRTQFNFDHNGRSYASTVGRTSTGAGINFSGASYLPGQFANSRTFNLATDFELGTLTTGDYQHMYTFGATYTKNWIPQDEQTTTWPAFGYQYGQNAAGQNGLLLDVNRDKDVPVTRRIPCAPMPVFTHDIYSLSGQGTGGVFRPHRSDIGLLHDETREDIAVTGGDMTAELAYGAGMLHVGVDMGLLHTTQYSGNWREGAADLFPLDFRAKGASDPLYEPFYMRSAGDMTASEPGSWDGIRGQAAARFRLGMSRQEDVYVAPKAQALLGSGGGFASLTSAAMQRPHRETRVQHIEHRTMAEINDRPEFNDRVPHIYELNELPSATSGPLQIDYDQSGSRYAHIGEIAVVEPTGMRYTYGLPVYNNKQKEVLFAVAGVAIDNGQARLEDSDYADLNSPTDLSDLPSVEQLVEGDHFYSSTELPPYVHSHLLTGMTSTDYVDLTDNGLSDDDLGHFVKFNYTDFLDAQNVGSYNWRAPFRGANYLRGHISNPEDDKGSYVFGEREMYYLHSIETKTHVALFILSDPWQRQDGRGALHERNNSSTLGASQASLERIELYRKNGSTPVLLKAVNFEYDYSLCGGVENSVDQLAGGGKLTLKRVWFEHLENGKGALSPYVFDYDETNPDRNPDYSYSTMDRWGNYKPIHQPYLSHEYPYVSQSAGYNERHDHASAWCLRSIGLPSGGTIEIDYESDDYATVEDKPAMEMCRIVSMGATDNYDHEVVNEPGKIRNNDLRLFFQLNTPLNPNDPIGDRDAAVRKYVGGLEQIYFKTWQRLKDEPGVGGDGWVWDYVEGYAKVDQGGAVGCDTGDPSIGYLTLLPEVHGIGNYQVHPFRKAGWQYLRYSRPDLFLPAQDPLNAGLNGVFSILNVVLGAADILFGYYNMANVKGYSKFIDVGRDDVIVQDEKPSYVRLLSPEGKKYGGGHRVSRIAFQDNWIEGAARYGQEYSYTKLNDQGKEISSGVASYEPLVGGQEIPHHQPVWYNGSDAMISFRDPEAYVELPFGESLYPNGSVGYSRVEVKDLAEDNDDVTENLGGITVHEFYTAADFPVRVNKTDLDHKPLDVDLFIPLIGTYSLHHHGYSQGYAVELNDMHGKPKAVSTYANCTAAVGQPQTRTSYHYSVDPNNAKRLNNTVNVLYDHWDDREAVLGQTVDFYVDLRETMSRMSAFRIETNFELYGNLPYFGFTLGFDHTSNMFRSVVTNKVINKIGILERVVNEVDGARTETRNLLYDAYTGQPLLTQQNNLFDDPVYTYNYAAHMAYEGMAGAYRNWGMELFGQTISLGTLANASAERFFHVGDEVEVTPSGGSMQVVWVHEVVPGASVSFRDAANSNAINVTNAHVKVRKSGRRNMQAVQNGTIVSLHNVVAQFGSMGLFDGFNANISGQSGISSYEYALCAGGSSVETASVSLTLTPTLCTGCVAAIEFSAPGRCSAAFPTGWIVFDAPLAVTELSELTILGFTGNSLSFGPLAGTGQEVLVQDSNGNVYQGVWSQEWAPGYEDCFGQCDRVIHADATEFANSWSYDYVDAGSPNVEPGGSPVALRNDLLQFNPHKYGQASVWRPLKNHVFQVDRLNPIVHYETDIRKNGEYEVFRVFDFADPNNNFQDRWVRREEMTRYDAFGPAVESRNAVDVYSSQLYGYDNSLVVAAAGNAGYYDIGFDGFEDHGTTTDPNGHLRFMVGANGAVVTDDAAHTGEQCLTAGAASTIVLSGTAGVVNEGRWSPMTGAKQVVSAWFRTQDDGSYPTLGAFQGGVPVSGAVAVADEQLIEGWTRVELHFTPAAGAFEVRFAVSGAASDWYLDDVRCHPFESQMTTYVYDPVLLWLRAELDDNNYATFYNYDEEGRLVQVKKETERGVTTLKTGRQNIPVQP